MTHGDIEGGERNLWYEGPTDTLTAKLTLESVQQTGSAPSSGAHLLEAVAVDAKGKEGQFSAPATVTFK